MRYDKYMLGCVFVSRMIPVVIVPCVIIILNFKELLIVIVNNPWSHKTIDLGAALYDYFKLTYSACL